MTFRPIAVLGLAALAGAAAACSTTGGGGPNSYRAELEELTANCRERGGILTPSPNPSTGRPQTDYFCEIRGATRIPNN